MRRTYRPRATTIPDATINYAVSSGQFVDPSSFPGAQYFSEDGQMVAFGGLSSPLLDPDPVKACKAFPVSYRENRGIASYGATEIYVESFAMMLIREGLNTWDNFIALARYGQFLGNNEVYREAIALLDGSEVLDPESSASREISPIISSCAAHAELLVEPRVGDHPADLLGDRLQQLPLPLERAEPPVEQLRPRLPAVVGEPGPDLVALELDVFVFGDPGPRPDRAHEARRGVVFAAQVEALLVQVDADLLLDRGAVVRREVGVGQPHEPLRADVGRSHGAARGVDVAVDDRSLGGVEVVGPPVEVSCPTSARPLHGS